MDKDDTISAGDVVVKNTQTLQGVHTDESEPITEYQLSCVRQESVRIILYSLGRKSSSPNPPIRANTLTFHNGDFPLDSMSYT